MFIRRQRGDNKIKERGKDMKKKILVTIAMVVGCGMGILSMTGCGIPGVSAAETDNTMDTVAMQTTEPAQPYTQDTPDTIVNEAPKTTVYEAPRKTYNDNSKTTIKEGSRTTVNESHNTTVNEAPRTNVTVSPETAVNEPPAVTASGDAGTVENEVTQTEPVTEETGMTTEEAVNAIIGVWLPENIDEYSEACHFGYLGEGGISSTGDMFGVNTFLVIPTECGSCGGASAMSTSVDGTTLTCSPIEDAYAAGATVGELQIDISQIDNDVIIINGVQYVRYSHDPSVRDYQE